MGEKHVVFQSKKRDTFQIFDLETSKEVLKFDESTEGQPRIVYSALLFSNRPILAFDQWSWNDAALNLFPLDFGRFQYIATEDQRCLGRDTFNALDLLQVSQDLYLTSCRSKKKLVEVALADSKDQTFIELSGVRLSLKHDKVRKMGKKLAAVSRCGRKAVLFADSSTIVR